MTAARLLLLWLLVSPLVAVFAGRCLKGLDR